MGIDIHDQDLMDDEIEEALFKLFSHQEEIIEDIFHHTQQNFQQTILSSIAEDEIEQNFDEDIHFSSPVFNDHIQQSCQFLCDQEVDQNIQSTRFSYHKKTSNNVPNHDNDSLQLPVNMEE